MGKKQGRRSDKPHASPVGSSSSSTTTGKEARSVSSASSPNKTSKSGKSGSKSKFGYDYSKDYQDPTWPFANGRMDKSAWLIIILTPTIVLSAVFYFKYQDMLRERVRQPLEVPRVVEAMPEDPSRFWGTYRPGVYFGMKTRTQHSPVVGLMWMTQFTGEMPPSIRHWCEQGDGLAMYSWFAHDGRNFGLQEIVDKYYILTTDFVKKPGGDHGGDWTARFSLKPRPGAEKVTVSLFFYAVLDPEGQGNLDAVVERDRIKHINGFTPELGQFRLSFSSAKAKKTNFLMTYAPSHSVLKEVLLQGMQVKPWGSQDLQYVALGGRIVPHDAVGPNYIVHQVTFNLPFQMEVIFESGSFTDRTNTLAGPVYQESLQQHLNAFDDKFESIFKLTEKGFSQEDIGYAKGALSNMVGGVGYFYGSSLVKSARVKEGALTYWPAPLYTGVPSRSFFPRGFLWDEGFHNVLLSLWDEQLSLDIIAHWMDLLNVEGWIPREQILGDEARAKVPQEFVVQHNENANPPTFFIPLRRLVRRLASSKRPEDRQYLRHLFPRLKVWYDWFNQTQAGPDPSSYRWRGRDATTRRELNPKTLTSGLDDYPRASHPSGDERHIDLRCWMALASGVMADIARAIGETGEEYEATHLWLTDNALLDRLHWSERRQRYADYGLHTDKVRLERPPPPPPRKNGGPPPPPREKERVEREKPQLQHVDTTFGYVSLFPLLLRVLEPESAKLGRLLQDLKDPGLLWTKFGLRSLAQSAPLYNQHNTEHDPPYWRGAVWMNINYLAVGALHHYSRAPGPHASTAGELYAELRTNLIRNVLGEFKRSGYVWENYDDRTGKGRGCHPFTGWSALVVAIMAEKYD